MTHHTFEHRTNVKIVDGEVLSRVSPRALAGHAVNAGWVKTGTYGQHSDIYEGKGLPELVVPRTRHLGDYANVVSQLIGIFAETGNHNELAICRALLQHDNT